MPYIKQIDRLKYNTALDQLPEIETKGDLEYIIFYAMKRYMQTREHRYSSLHDCSYAAAHCSDEFRRRYLDTREDVALTTNGDIISTML